MKICTHCEKVEATTTLDKEPICEKCLADWWYDNSFTCDNCGAEKVPNDELKQSDYGNFCSWECEGATAQEAQEQSEHEAFEGHYSNFT